MIKLNIFNMKGFLKVIDECKGTIKMLDSDGRRLYLKANENLQNALLFEFFQNKNYLSITLEMPEPGDYFRILNFVL